MNALRPERVFLGAIFKRDRPALAVTIIGCTVAALVAIFQFAVFTSFLRASHVVPSMVNPSAWIIGHRVDAFDFPYLISEDYRGLAARCFRGAAFKRILFGFAPWISPDGRHGNVAVAGLEDTSIPPRTFFADASDRQNLDLAGTRQEAEIGGVSMRLWRFDDRLATFLGSPYTVMRFSDAARVLDTPPTRTSFIAVFAREPQGQPLEAQIECARAALPEVTILSATEFNRSSAVYWLLKTGAGAAILIAALLGSLLMTIILTSGVSRFAQRRQQDLMSMLAVGCDRRLIHRILLSIGLFFSFVSTALALALAPIADIATNGMVPWVHVKAVDVAFAVCIALVGSISGVAAAVSQTRRFKVSDVFRQS